MRFANVWLGVGLGGLALAGPAGESFKVDPDVGNNTFSAVFDAPLGERINAVSSQLNCDLTLSSGGDSVSGVCSVPLSSIMVDNEPTKTEHFQQWSTNKKMEPKQCKFEVKLAEVKLSPALSDKTPSKFAADLPFTICGRSRDGGGKEHVEGTASVLLGRDPKTLKVRATVAKFNRESYHVGPKWTDGWFSRVQQLAPVVSTEGAIELTFFATAPAPKK